MSLSESSFNARGAHVLRVGVLSGIGSIDPRRANDTVTALVLSQVFESPLALRAGSDDPSPQLFAERPQPEASARPFTVFSAPVRTGVPFSDGTAMTIDHLVGTLRRSGAVISHARVEARGDRVWFTLQESNPRFELLLAQAECAIVLEKGGTFLGTGAFMFANAPRLAEVEKQKVIRLVRNPHYYGTCSIDEIEFAVHVADADGTPTSLIASIGRGEIDFTTSLSMSDVTSNHLPIVPAMHPGDSTAMLYFNTERPQLRDPRVRHAIASSLDIAKIASQTFDRNPVAFIASSILPPMMGRHSTLIRHSRAEAEQLFRQPGVEKPKVLSLLVPWSPRPYLPKPLPAAKEIQRQLAEIGIAIELRQPATAGEFLEALAPANWDTALAGWVADNPDPADFLTALLASRNIPQPGEYRPNISRYSNPKMDEALIRFREKPDDTTKGAVLKIVQDDVPLMPLVHGASVSAHSRRVRKSPMPNAGMPRFVEFEMS